MITRVACPPWTGVNRGILWMRRHHPRVRQHMHQALGLHPCLRRTSEELRVTISFSMKIKCSSHLCLRRFTWHCQYLPRQCRKAHHRCATRCRLKKSVRMSVVIHHLCIVCGIRRHRLPSTLGPTLLRTGHQVQVRLTTESSAGAMYLLSSARRSRFSIIPIAPCCQTDPTFGSTMPQGAGLRSILIKIRVAACGGSETGTRIRSDPGCITP